jgi:predicted dehydrogenase
MEAPVKIAFVGCGGHASGSLYPQFQFIDEIDLVAVVDAVEEKRLRMRRRAARLRRG